MGKYPIVSSNAGGAGFEATGDVDLEAGSISSGSPEEGSPSAFGQGLSYTEGMVVITTDGTATSTTEGGNLTDVSADAASETGSTFSFQGTTANHTIVFGSEVDDADTGDKAKHYGLDLRQTVAAVEVVKRSFAVELWTGAAWTEIGTLATSLWTEAYRYANELFIRANSDENLNYGIDHLYGWTKKTILGKNLFWARIRITDNLTTSPVFEQSKLVPSSTTVNASGVLEFRGRAKFRQTLQTAGNVFGESGAVSGGNFSVGSGGLPTGWGHELKNSIMTADGAALYFQYTLPRGLDTGFPLGFKVEYIAENPNSTPADFILSCLPVEVVGVYEADPTGGIAPVKRTAANTETVIAKPAQVLPATLDISMSDRVYSYEFLGVDVSNYYEGDLILIRLEADDLHSPPLTAVAILAIEISGVKFSLGERL